MNYLVDGDSILHTLGPLLPLVLALIGLVVWLVRNESSIKELRKDVDEMKDCVDKHVKDNAAHVNQLHIGNLERRIGNLEVSLKDLGKELSAGHERISDKIDLKFDQLAARMR